MLNSSISLLLVVLGSSPTAEGVLKEYESKQECYAKMDQMIAASEAQGVELNGMLVCMDINTGAKTQYTGTVKDLVEHSHYVKSGPAFDGLKTYWNKR